MILQGHFRGPSVSDETTLSVPPLSYNQILVFKVSLTLQTLCLNVRPQPLWSRNLQFT